jgi:hypothetical protein
MQTKDFQQTRDQRGAEQPKSRAIDVAGARILSLGRPVIEPSSSPDWTTVFVNAKPFSAKLLELSVLRNPNYSNEPRPA